MSLKKVIFSAIVLMASVCRADQTIPAGLAEEAKMATGYDSKDQKFVGSCLKGNYEEYGQQKSNINFTQSISQSEMSKELGIDGSGRFKYGAATIGMSAKFLKNTQESAYSIVAIYSGDYKFKSLLYTLPKLADGASGGDAKGKGKEYLKELLSQTGLAVQHDDTRWEKTCGDEFVAQIERGAKLFYSIRIDFSSSTEKDLFEASFSYDSSYASVQAHLKNEVNKYSKNAQVTVGALQIGGDASKITGLFHGENEDGAALGFVKCSSGQLEACDKVMANAIQYATKEFPEQLKYDLSKNDGKGPAYLGYITKPYETVGLYPNYSKELKHDVINKRRQIEDLFDRQLAQLNQADFLMNSPTVLRSPRQKKLLKQTFDQLTKNIELIVSVAEVCYNDMKLCGETANTILAGPGAIQEFDENIFILNPETFRQYCSQGNSPVAPSDLAKSISGMIAAAEELEPDAFKSMAGQTLDKCQVSDMVFARNTDIWSLKNRGISKLQPLAEYKHFVKVNLSGNDIQDVSALANWESIEELNLHDNDIRELDGIASLPLLRQLRISNNQLRSIDGLINAPKLERVDARNNYPQVTCENLPNVKTCLKASVKTDSNFTPLYTNTVIPLFMPSIARIDDNQFFITGLGMVGSLYSAESNSFRSSSAYERSAYGANSVALKNGNILISGGWGAGNQLYEYNPLTNEMLATSGLQVPRVDHQAVVLNDGRVLITGGWEHSIAWSGTDPTFTAEIYDPATRTSKLIKQMKNPRAWHTATLLESGSVLIVGGYTNANSDATAEMFDPQTETFTSMKASMRIGRGGHSATRMEDGNILIVGGFTKYNVVTTEAETFNVSSNRFENVSEPLNVGRAQHSAILLKNGKVLITGGSNKLMNADGLIEAISDKDVLAQSELYDPVENSFAQIPTNMFVPRTRHAMIETKLGSVLIVGGIDSISAKHSEVFSYTDTEFSWLP